MFGHEEPQAIEAGHFYSPVLAFAVLALAAALDALVAIRLRAAAVRLLARAWPPALAILCLSALMAARICSLMPGFIVEIVTSC